MPRRPTPVSGSPYAASGGGDGRLQRRERERLEALQHAAGEIGGQPLGMGLDLGQLGHRRRPLSHSYCVRSRTVGEHAVEGGEHRLRVDQHLLVAEEPDASGDERLLGVELAGGDGDGGRPVLLHAHVLGVGRPGAERRLAVADLEVVRDVALGTVADDLGDADRVVVRRAPRATRSRATSRVSSRIHARLR